MLLGAHESAAGGLYNAFARCARDGADALQLWTRSSRQWAARPLDDELIAQFRAAHAAFPRVGRRLPTAAHASYLINLATANDAIWDRSVATLLQECERAEQLGVSQVIVHPGARQALSLDSAIDRVAKALVTIDRALGRRKKVRLLLEITAGQGSCVGCSFEELAEMLERSGVKRLGICLDTQHMYAAGIDWTTQKGYAATWRSFDKLIGLDRLLAFHVNDSKKPLGSRVDRHAIIGEGIIGLESFGRLVRDRRFAALPGYLETPPLPNGEDSYALGLSRLRTLL